MKKAVILILLLTFLQQVYSQYCRSDRSLDYSPYDCLYQYDFSDPNCTEFNFKECIWTECMEWVTANNDTYCAPGIIAIGSVAIARSSTLTNQILSISARTISMTGKNKRQQQYVLYSEESYQQYQVSLVASVSLNIGVVTILSPAQLAHYAAVASSYREKTEGQAQMKLAIYVRAFLMNLKRLIKLVKHPLLLDHSIIFAFKFTTKDMFIRIHMPAVQPLSRFQKTQGSALSQYQQVQHLQIHINKSICLIKLIQLQIQMILSFAKLKLSILLLWLVSQVLSQPGYGVLGGTDCPSGVRTSYDCDQRCAAASGTDNGRQNRYCSQDLSNYYCTCGCAAGNVGGNPSYFWYMYDNRTCTYGCPPNYYPPASGGYACLKCNTWCLTCTGSSNTACTTCNSSAFQLNSTSCYAYDPNVNPSSVTTKINPCPNGFYGVQITKSCAACDTGCAICAIQLTKEMPNGQFFGSSYTNYNQVSCNCTGNNGDTLCRYTLKCYSCSVGYTLVNGFCRPQSSCLAYSYYNSLAGGSFSSSNCLCYTGFQSIFPGYCTKCAIQCNTCTGSSSTQCASCPTGASGTSCTYNSTLYANHVDWTSSMPVINGSGSAWTINVGNPYWNVTQGSCSNADYVFGYYGYYNKNVYPAGLSYSYGQSMFPSMATLFYTNPTAFSGVNHYAVNFRATILFIDDWSNGLSIIFSEGGSTRFLATFQMQGIAGEYLCGYNTYDHLDIVDNTFSHTSAGMSLKIYSAATGYAWGIRDIIIKVLKCDSSCATCNGSSSSNCLTCVDTTKTAVSGVCVCNFASGYFLNSSNACTQSCSPLIENNLTYQCVSSCSFPNYFIFTNSGTGVKSCVVNCPTDYYKKTVGTVMSCVLDCYDISISVANIATNQFKFNATELICYNACPTGTYGDHLTQSCVPLCSTLNSTTTEGYFSYNGFCYTVCPSGYAYVPQRACLSQCPSGYYKNLKASGNSNICQQQCSISLGGLYRFADNSTGWCTQTCATGTYGDIKTYKCLAVCNSSAFGQDISGTRLCVTNCSNTNNIYGNPLTGLCVTPYNCATNYYGDPLTFKCTLKCSGSGYFADNYLRTCITTTCNNGTFRQNDTQICVQTCQNNNSLLKPEWGDVASGYCVNTCYGALFGDPQNNSLCVSKCAASPKPTFGLDFLCVVNCSNTTWADPYHTNRICTTSCTSSTSDSYGYNTTRTCVLSCPDGQFAHNVSSVPLCVYGCMQSSGLFGNIINNRCQAQCPSPYYGDVTGNRTCVLKCPWPYYASNCSKSGSNIIISNDRVCRTDCSSCGWADNSSQTCAWDSSGCANLTYAHEDNNKCVIPTGCTGFADPVSRHCVTTCKNLTTTYYYGDPSTKTCVLICPQSPNFYGDNATQTCNYTCSGSYVRDPQYLRRCVNQNGCSRTPLVLYGDSVKALCVVALNCSDGYYGDNNTNKCVSVCPGPTYIYSDNVTKECVQQCQLGWYGLNVTTSPAQGICSQYCPLGQWGDNYTVLCTTRCSAKTYGVNFTASWTVEGFSYTSYGVCKNECPDGQFARDADNLCVSNCSYGGYTNIWGDPTTKTCKTDPKDCPLGYYANDYKFMCVIPSGCSIVSSIQYVADNQTNKCVNKCPQSKQNFADMSKYLCVAKCPQGFYGYNSTLKCVQSCRFANNTYDGSFADPQLNICVQICSATPKSLFGQNSTYTCVQAKYCPSLTWAQVTVYNRQCRPYCPGPNTNNANNLQMYADNLTFSCVSQCPTYSYADLSTGVGICVYVCPSLSNGTLQFADNSTKKCVIECPSSQSTFGDNKTLSCVQTCPIGSYAQDIIVPRRYCVQKCALTTWGEDIKRTCVKTPLECPTVNGSFYYAENISTMCVKMCPAPTGSTAGSWGQNTTRACLPRCNSTGVQSGFEWNLTRVCIDICPAQIGIDGSYSDQGMCYFVCMTSNYYRDPQYNRSCQSNCTFSPNKQYADDTTYKCVPACPTFPMMYYSYQPTKKCVATCPNSYRKLQSNKSCISNTSGCPSGTFFNPDTYQCLAVCPFSTTDNLQLFGDTSQPQAKCVTSASCPYLTYADTNVYLCVSNCSDGQWIDVTKCVYDCPDGYYGNPLNRSCVLPAYCPQNYYADNVTQTCVTTCAGSFSYAAKKTCLLVCPDDNGTLYYADPVTRACSINCTYNATIKLVKNNANFTCVSECSPPLFFNPFTYNCSFTCSNYYYSDNSTRTCVPICPATPPLFGENAGYTCVQECLNTSQFQYLPGRMCVYPCPTNYFMENVTRNCVTYCPDGTYANTTNGYCVKNCTPTYSYDGDNTCVSTCPSPYFKDPTTFKCVVDCPNYPTAYFEIVQGTNRQCDTACPNGQFRDFTNYICTAKCPLSPLTFADQTSGSCLAVCSASYYGQLTNRTCNSTCPNSMFADPNTRMCVEKCDPKLGFFGDNNLAIPACVAVCSSGRYADEYTQTCTSVCKNSPKMYAYDNGNTNNPVRQCVYSCPYPWVADNTTSRCFLQCNNAAYPYLDLALKSCVVNCSSPVYAYRYMPIGQTQNGQCVKFCPTVGSISFFALLTNNSCVTKCPNGLYGMTMNNTCASTCILGDNTYADPANNLCVPTCTHNATYFSYANQFTRTCVTTCPTNKGLVGDRQIWKCVKRCSNLSQYADLNAGYCVSQCPLNYFKDNTTQTCISNCSLKTLMYGDTSSRTCVTQCLTTSLYADDTTRLCVVSTSCSAGLFGYNTSRVCVAKCPTTPSLYGDPIGRTCVTDCPLYPDIYFADTISRTCVLKCPSIPAYYAQNYTQKCVLFCPNYSYADNYTRLCIGVCSIVNFQTFADNSTNLCVKICPTKPNYYASNYTWECVQNCPSSPPMYADNSTRSCVYYCPGGAINTYADDSTRRCVDICPNSTYNQNSTRQCLANCLTGYADPATKYCISICPRYSYGDNSTNSCVLGCPSVYSVQTYAEDGNNICMSNCLAFFNTYADPYSKRCVKICPISQGYFAQPNSRTCVPQCPDSPLLFADFSTRFCVPICPKMPALFAINTSRVCTAVCPDNTWADNKTRVCLSLCVTTPQTFGDNSTWACVAMCPTKPNYYADNSTHLCVPRCPPTPDFYGDNVTRKCVYSCPIGTFADPVSRRCVTTCPDTYYGQNSSRRCLQACPWRQFADILLRLCVAQCSVDPIYYGNPDTLKCVTQCPQVNNSYGNPLSQQCVNYQANNTSGCPIAYFSDNSTRLCVQVCPMAQDTYGDNSTWKCVVQCPAGSVNTFSDNSTMRCVKICPAYPDYYAQPFSRRCVHFCLQPNSTFSGSFSDNSTRTCTQTCPSTPDYFADNSTGRCVFYCPRTFSGLLTFADNSTRRCVNVCPSSPDIFGDISTLRCVPLCPASQKTYADNNTRRCVKLCPQTPSPPLFADNSSQRCLPACPNNSFADNLTRRCVAKCPRFPQTYADPSTSKCVITCPVSPDLYADPISQQCIPLCQFGFFAQNTTRKCLQQCPYNLINYADNQTRRCVSRCPANQLTYGDNQTQRCVKQCPTSPLITYADNVTQTCIKICNNISTGGYADNVTRICVQKCPDRSYGDKTTRYCVRYCPVGWYAHDENNLCVSFCPTPYFGDNSTWTCVRKCPVAQNLFGSTYNNTCVFVCPQGTYASQQDQACVTRCPNSTITALKYDTFGYNTTNQCVNQCPIPLYGYPVAQVCVDICPNPYYENITDHRCYACPVECASCTAPYNCLTCQVNHYLYSGACVQSCPTFPIITYANPSRICGKASQCTQGFYALNATKSCVSTCPAGYYVNIAQQTCDSCMKGCVSCLSYSSCLACNIDTAIWSNYTCYVFCSASKKYYTAKGCVGICPNGTYLSLTTCQSCSRVCLTCQVTAQNCLICANGYYRSNGICVSQCPKGTTAQQVNGSQTCVSCNSTPCATKPLTYSTTQFVNNYQYNVQIQFSQSVSIQQINKAIQLQQLNKKRLLVTNYSYLDYTIIDHGNGLYSFVMNNYDPSSGSQIQVQITDPSAIKSSSGQMPQTTRSSLTVNAADNYNLDYYNPGIDGYIYAVVISAFILLLFTFGTHQSIWMPMYDFMQLCMSIILVNVTFPPNLLYSVKSLFGSAFTFLPNFFASAFSQAAFTKEANNNNIYSIMQDGAFLRVFGNLYTVFVAFIIILLIIYLIGKKSPNKDIKKWAKSFVKQTVWRKHLHGLVYIFFLPVFILGLYDTSIYSYLGSSGIQIFSILSSFIFMITFFIIVIYFTYKIRKLTKDYPIAYLMIQKAYNFIAYQKTVLIQNKNHYFTFQKNEVDITNARQPRINQLLIFPYPIETKAGPMQITLPLFSYTHKFLTALFLAISFGNPVIQIILLILVNIAYIAYIAVKRPFFSVKKRQFNNEIYIHNLIVVTIIDIVLLVFVFLYSQLSTQIKVLIGNIICGLILYGVTVNIIYFFNRTYNFYHHYLWKEFVKSQMFKINYIIEHLQWTKSYEEEQKKLMSEVKPRSQFLEAIHVETGQSLAGMVVRAPSVSTNTKLQIKALQLRPNKVEVISKEYGQLFTHMTNQKQKSHKSIASSERLSKNDRKKVRDLIFGQKQLMNNQGEKYKKLELISEKNEGEAVSNVQLSEQNQTQYEYELIEEQYPQGTPMQQIMKGCAKGDVVMHL